MIRLLRFQATRVALLSCLLGFSVTSVHAQSPERLKAVLSDSGTHQAAIAGGKRASSFCANCHGVDGNSKLSEVPNLAGQNPIYLLNQVNKFYTGERKDPWMEPAIRLLNESERLNIVAYFTAMRVVPARSGSYSRAGEQLFHRVCARCHGPQALGGERFPRLAGQQHTYLIQSLTRYRDRTGTRMEPEMLAMTAGLSDSDIRALADYLSGLR
ncbi:MAG: c-type cytochrome [Gammaproteobacteria bacterium]|nr:c-type cytochrome [Gammaproteobacteria bacterium]MBU1414547.1 c-type cytochrome [Gammaproteobacteria bacterium]